MADKVAVGVADDMGESMQCVDHPYRSNPGGVCAFCLQEKLGKLVSSSKSTTFLPLQPSPSSSTSSPASFRPDVAAGGGLAPVYSCNGAPACDGRRTKFPYLAVGRSKKKKGSGDVSSYANGGRKFVASGASHTTASVVVANGGGLALKRSMSVAPRTTGSSLAQVGVGRSNGEAAVADSPRKKSFWSFLYHSSVSSSSTSFSSAVNGNSHRRRSTSSSSGGGCEGSDASKQHPQPPSNNLEAETGRRLAENSSAEDAQSPSGSQASSSFGRKVSRSRSVGCGSRSFSGDFLERISTGFGDCTLRRVESQREAKPKTAIQLNHNKNNDGDQQHTMKERIKCGGLFGGLGMMSAYWLSAAAADDDYDIRSRASASTPAARTSVPRHGRTRTWGLAFASPMRAFRPHSSSSRSLSAINAAASTGPATNIISSINVSKENITGHDGGGKQSSLDRNASFMAVS